MPLNSISRKPLCGVGVAGLVAIITSAHTGSAQNLNDMARTLNNIVNPGDAQQLEDQARRNGRSQEERYWRDYRAGLDSPNSYRRDYGPDYRGAGDYRYPRDGGYSGDSGYRRAYPDQRDYPHDRR
jgi:hypothetical protein